MKKLTLNIITIMLLCTISNAYAMEVESKSSIDTQSQIIVVKKQKSKKQRPIKKSKHVTCPTCNKEISTQCNFARHMRSHTGEKPFKCTTCGRGFTQNSNCTRHMLTHMNEKPFQCTTCGEKFRRGDELKSHLNRIHMQTHSVKRKKRKAERISHKRAMRKISVQPYQSAIKQTSKPDTQTELLTPAPFSAPRAATPFYREEVVLAEAEKFADSVLN